MNNGQIGEVLQIVDNAIQHAVATWEASEKLLKIAMDSVSFEDIHPAAVISNIPGHPFLFTNKSDVSEFIAFVVDMRDSTAHLKTRITSAKASELQRVYYETSALLPALAKTIEYEGGSVTEYLGDGLLALFKVDAENRSEALYAARRAAIDCLTTTRAIVNNRLYEYFQLPEIDIGVGMAISPAIVLLVGLEGNQHPKVIGSCVYTATKLACERNKIYTDEFIQHMWPTSKGGNILFIKREVRSGVTGYELTAK